MTGRDLIIFILENNLENIEIFKEGIMPGFVTVSKFAEMKDVGEATVKAWVEMNRVPTAKIGKEIYIPKHCIEEIDNQIERERK